MVKKMKKKYGYIFYTYCVKVQTYTFVKTKQTSIVNSASCCGNQTYTFVKIKQTSIVNSASCCGNLAIFTHTHQHRY